MATELKKVAPSVYEVNYTVSGEAFKTAGDKALKKLVDNVTIKGFRKGKAPLNLAKERISGLDLANETINQSINPAYQEVLKEHKLVPNFQPLVDCTEYKEDSLTLKFTIYTVPTCKLGQYKGIKIPMEEVKVNEEEINKAIEQTLKDNAELVIKESAAEIGDTVILDFKGYVDGKEFEGGSADNFELVLGSNQFVPGFEDQLVGALPESKVDVNITFPEQYVKDLAGKAAKFVCMIHEIKTKKEPELNDEFVSSLAIENVKTVEELKEHKKNELLRTKTNNAKNQQFTQLIAKIVENSEFEISDRLIEAQASENKKQTIAQIEQNGITFEMYKEITGLDDKTFEENLKQGALNYIKEELVLNQVATDEHLTIAPSELDKYYEDVSARYGMPKEEVIKVLKPNEQGLIRNLYQNKVERFLILNNLENNEAEVKAEKKPAKKAVSKKKKEEKTEETTENN